MCICKAAYLVLFKVVVYSYSAKQSRRKLIYDAQAIYNHAIMKNCHQILLLHEYS